MANYQMLYFFLFNACTDALRQLEQQNFGAAKEILIRAQQDAEEAYIDEPDSCMGTDEPSPATTT